MTKIILDDCKELGFCNHGLREMCKSNNIDWWEFLQNGIDITEVEHIDDENMRAAIAVAKLRENKG